MESVEAAKWLVEHGADPARKNDEGQNVRSRDYPMICSGINRCYHARIATSSNGASAKTTGANGRGAKETILMI